MKQRGIKAEMEKRADEPADDCFDDSDFWLLVCRSSLDLIWNNSADDIYAPLAQARLSD